MGWMVADMAYSLQPGPTTEQAGGWAAELGFINWPVLREIDVFLDPIRGGPIFEEFLEEVRVRWEGFKP
jgi:hypothetical protein